MAFSPSIKYVNNYSVYFIQGIILESPSLFRTVPFICNVFLSPKAQQNMPKYTKWLLTSLKLSEKAVKNVIDNLPEFNNNDV